MKEVYKSKFLTWYLKEGYSLTSKEADLENIKKASEMKILNKRFVVRPLVRKTTEKNFITDKYEYFEQPNFGAFQQCLCGVLKKGETLDQFRLRWILKKQKHVI